MTVESWSIRSEKAAQFITITKKLVEISQRANLRIETANELTFLKNQKTHNKHFKKEPQPPQTVNQT